jgi:hypothetical protein
MLEMIDSRMSPGWFDTRKSLNCKLHVIYLSVGNEVIYQSSDEIPTKKERDLLEIRDSLIRRVREIKENFSDLRYRQMAFFDLKEALRSAEENFKGDPALFNLIICLFYATKNQRSENLTSEQIDVLETAICKIDRQLNESDADTIIKDLISVGFLPLPRFDGLVEIYERQGEI